MAASQTAGQITGEIRPDLLRDELLHEVFATTAAWIPGKRAVRCGKQTLTYRELHDHARRAAHYLRSLGVERGKCVVLWMPRSIDMYVAMLAIMEAGGVYVPMDPDFPLDRVAYAARDCSARCILTSSELAPATASGLPCETLCFDELEAEMAAQSSAPLGRQITRLTPDDCAYILYTSGSTGRPKGVMISHRSICHLVRSEGVVLDIAENDLVFQGFSLSFDMSLEEIWPAWSVGATLLTGTQEMMRTSGDLAALLTKEGVTVWSCVPTLLALQETQVPSLRLLNLGGEACPPELVRRWARPGLRILNTYGPTETTITATVAELAIGKPVTIGRPLPNYSAILLDEQGRPVQVGESGELCIGGPGLALGYVGRPDLTSERFIPNPFAGDDDTAEPIIYRTGDLARLNEAGEIEYLGRMDTQIKIRGYRVELSEIEQVLVSVAPLRTAVVRLWRDSAGVDTLVAYLVPRDDLSLDLASLRRRLREQLPVYMVPTLLEVVGQLPVLASGKVDRKNLPEPSSKPINPPGGALPQSPVEKKLHAVWREVFSPTPVSIDEDFFTDLGGHSLRAASAVSKLRRDPAFSAVSMLDIYHHPTIRQLAAELERRSLQTANTKESSAKKQADTRPFAPIPFWRHFLCGAAQAISLVGIYTVFSLQWLVPYLAYAWMTNLGMHRLPAIALALSSFILAIPLMLAFGIAGKWLILGRLRPGEYPLWGFIYFRFWLSQRLVETAPIQYLGGTPLMSLYYRLLGARIGRNVHLSDDTIKNPDCVSIGANTSFSAGASIISTRIEGGRLLVGNVMIGNDCNFGVSSSVSPGATIGNHVEIGHLTMIPPGATVGSNERWEGSPARKIGPTNSTSAVPPPARGMRFVYGGLFASILLFFPAFAIMPFFPGMALMAELDQQTTAYDWLLLSPLLAILFVIVMGLEIAAVKWLLIGRVRPGHISLHSSAYVRHWIVSKLMELSLDAMSPLYATVFLNPWYRLLGVKLGARAEISTASSISFDLLEIGEESFIADAVMLGAPHLKGGELVFERTRVGKRAFVGNSAVIPSGTKIGDGVLIGVLSIPPASPADALKPNSSWFGTPAIFLPQRQTAHQFDEGSTFRPRRRLLLQRIAIEGVRILLPLSCTVALTSMMMSAVVDLHDLGGWNLTQIVAFFPVLYLAYGALAGLIVLILKWLVIGRYRPVEKPLWSRFVWRSELVTSIYENLAVPFLLEPMRGTPFLAMYLRLLGCKIGRRVFLDTTDFTEHDVVSIGDEAELNNDCGPQTHLFEDRVMKISNVEIGSRCTVGEGSIVLYDACMEDGSSLGPLSLLMKGETLPAGTSWSGSPAQRN